MRLGLPIHPSSLAGFQCVSEVDLTLSCGGALVTLANHLQPFTCSATRNLPAANLIPQQSRVNLETSDVNVLEACCMVGQGEEGVEMAAAGRDGINQLRSGLNCTALTVQCRRQDLSPPKTRTCPNCPAIHSRHHGTV